MYSTVILIHYRSNKKWRKYICAHACSPACIDSRGTRTPPLMSISSKAALEHLP